jgi:hypothetical protein
MSCYLCCSKTKDSGKKATTEAKIDALAETSLGSDRADMDTADDYERSAARDGSERNNVSFDLTTAPDMVCDACVYHTEYSAVLLYSRASDACIALSCEFYRTEERMLATIHCK